MRLSLVPRQTQFYDLFSEAGENVLEAAKLVQKRFGDISENGVVDQEAVKEREHDGDRITGEIIGLLNTQYITPLDRDDIYGLASAIDDVVDYLDDASELIDIYHVESAMPQALEQCRVLVGAAEHLRNALRELRTLRGVSKHLIALKQLEDEGDTIEREALGALFQDKSISPLVVIQWKDIFESLEAAIDSCETAAHLIGNIVVKGS
jgi:predicted phosphate transport protein (TIGR00153 family)